MAQRILQKPVNTFIGGLITEASVLTFPENASVDELNCDLERTGVRTRRKGIELEDSAVLSSFSLGAGKPLHSITWSNVSNETGVEFLVVQSGGNLLFYDKSVTPASSGEKSFSISLLTFSAPNGLNPANFEIAGDSVNGQFVVCSPAIESFVITYDPDTDTISTSQINPKIRDFEWQGDVLEYFKREPIASTTDERIYDTVNAGWVSAVFPNGGGEPVLIEHKSASGAYPQLTHPWFAAGYDPSGDWRITIWGSLFGGTSLSGNGHYILDLYNKDRTQAVADDPWVLESITLPAEVEDARFSTVATFSGRVWFSGLSSKKNGSKVFFSKVIENDEDYNKFYQGFDPTAEDFNELTDSDGGVINLPQASKIKALFEWGASMMVFAENGVWQIKGVDGVFKATEFAITRLRQTDGLQNSRSLVGVEGVPVWWGTSGIFTIEADQVSGEAIGSDLSKTTIQTFWENIGQAARNSAKGVYDQKNKRVMWLYSTDTTNLTKYNGILVLDTVIQAFFPWLIEDEPSNTNYIVGASYFNGFGSTEEVNDVVVGGVLVEASGVQVTVTQSVSTFNDLAEIKYIVRDGFSSRITFARMENDSFLDWGTEDFSSYAEAAYDFMNSLTAMKSPVYITCYFDVTETGWAGSEVGGYSPINPSGCFLKAFWDLKTDATSNRQVYKFQRPILVDSTDLTTFNYPYESVVTKNRVRGRGKVLKLRFESESQKDFRLQGYEVLNAANQSV